MSLALGLNNPRTGTASGVAATAASGLDGLAEGMAVPAVEGMAAPAVEGMHAAVEGLAKGLDEPAEGMSTALALARSLLPTVPLPAVECNLPVLEVQRYICLYAFCLFFTMIVVHIS